jgi:hypothetical protein
LISSARCTAISARTAKSGISSSKQRLLEALDTGALWSVARGLARDVNAYKGHLAACDQTRRNDLDGRGNLSEESLVEFTRFFLTTCILLWTEEEIRLDRLPPRSGSILEALLYRGQLQRGEAAGIVATGDRQARRIVSALIERGVLVAGTSRAPLRLAFPATLASRWFPGLFPDRLG